MTERDIFLNALERDSPAEREAYLDAACAGRPLLRRRVDELLRCHQEDPTFLNVPAMEQLAAAEESLAFLGPRAEPGTLGRLDHYDVLEIVGHGSTGVVLKARDAKLQRVVALKALATRLAPSAAARKRFVREAQAAAAVRDDNVVSIYAVSEDGPVPYLVMEYISGLTLEQRLQQGKALEIREILRIGMQLGAGLAAAHAQGLVHRDIKPANILLENGVQRVKITDFGLARIAAEAAATTAPAVAGTPPYMSPEQAHGQPIDHRTDLFSFGSVLYTLCAGVPPFRGDTTSEVLTSIKKDPPRPVRELNPGVPEWLSALIGELLAKDPAARPASARAVADTLAGRLAQLQQPSSTLPSHDEPVASVKSASRSQTAPAYRGVIIALCVVAALVGVVLVFLLLSRRAASEAGDKAETDVNRSGPFEPLNLRRENIPPVLVALAGGGDTTHAPAELAAVLGDGRFLLPRVGHTAWMQQSPDGKLLAVPVDQEVALFDIPTGAFLRSLKGPGGRVFHAAFSPDSRLLAATTRHDAGGGSVNVWELASKTRLWSKAQPGPKVPGAAVFSRDGQHLFTEGNGRIYVWRSGTGAAAQELEIRPRGVGFICISPDGHRLVASAFFEGLVTVFDWNGQKLTHARTLRGHTGFVDGVAYSADGKLFASGDEKQVRVWDAVTLNPLRVLNFPGQEVTFTRDSQVLFAAATTEMAKQLHSFNRWDVRSQQELPPLEVPLSADPVRAFHCLSSDGKLLFVAPEYAVTYIRVIDTSTGKEMYPRRAHSAPLDAVSISPNGRTAASAGEDWTVKLWDLASGRLRHTLKGHAAAVCGLAFSPDGALLASASRDGTIAVWDADSGGIVRALLGHARSFPRIQFSPDGKTVAGGGENGAVKLWDVSSGQERSPLLGHSGAVRCVAFSSDGTRLASGGEDRNICVHDLTRGGYRKISMRAAVNEVAFSSDGRFLAAVDDAPDAAVGFWDMETGKETICPGHSGDIHGLALSPDGSLAATSGEDGTVRLWDCHAAPSKPRTIGPGSFGGAVRAVAFTPDGGYLATANANGTVYLLRVPPPAR